MSEGTSSSAAQSQTLFLTEADVTAVSDWAAAIDTLRRAYAADIDPQSVPPRSMARAPGVWLRGLTAISPLDGYLGCKLIAASTRSRCASYLIALFDQTTTQLHALIDGNQITGIRTAGTAAVAVSALAPQRPLQVAMLGSGFEARAQLTALAAVRKIAGATVCSPTVTNRERFALAATRGDVDFTHKLIALSDVIGGRRAARKAPEDIVLYKSVGSALQDVVIAELLLARARVRGIGTLLPVSIAAVTK